MVNPGAFQKYHKEFLLMQKAVYAQAVAGGFMHDCVADIQCHYFKCYPIDYPHNQEPISKMTLGVNDDAPEPEHPMLDSTIMSEDEYKLVEEVFQKRCVVVRNQKEVCGL
jgi:hypothetical protein